MTFSITGGSTTNFITGAGQFYPNPVVTITPIPVSSGGVTTPVNIKDAVGTQVINTTNNNLSCNVPIISYTNNTPTICDTSTFPLVNTLTNGLGNISFTTGLGNLVATFNCTTSTSSTGYLTGYTTGSIAKTINNLVLNAIGTYTTPDPSFMNLYNTSTPSRNYNTNIYTKNIIDTTPYTELTSISPTITWGFPVTLISPRHIIADTHVYAVTVGSTHVFTDKNGTSQTRTVIGYAELGNDISIGYLDAVVSGITPYSVLPKYTTTQSKYPLAGDVSSQSYLPFYPGVLAFFLKQRYVFGGLDYVRQMQITGLNNVAGSNTLPIQNHGPSVIAKIISNDVRYNYSKNWNTTVLDGDSSAPVFLPTGLTTETGTPLTLLVGGTWFPGFGPAYSGAIDTINTSMNTLKTNANTAGQSPVDTTMYALNDISTSTNVIYNNGVATTGADWWNSFNSY